MGSFWCFQADKMWNKRKEQNPAFIALHSWTLNDPFLCKKTQPFLLFLSSKKELLFSFLDDAIRIYGSDDTEVSAKKYIYSFRHNIFIQIIFKSLWIIYLILFTFNSWQIHNPLSCNNLEYTFAKLLLIRNRRVLVKSIVACLRYVCFM